MKKLLAVLAVLALGACSTSNPVAPTAVKTQTNHVASSRYILISGDAPRPGCTDTGDGFQSCP
jgi:hypothetical protein